MGYESKLFIVDKSYALAEPWGEVIASFDLCCVPDIDFNKYPATDCYIYEGNEKITEDCYGSPLKELTISEAVEEIKTAMAKDRSYRRWKPVLGLLKGFKEDDWDCLRVLHYGH